MEGLMLCMGLFWTLCLIWSAISFFLSPSMCMDGPFFLELSNSWSTPSSSSSWLPLTTNLFETDSSSDWSSSLGWWSPFSNLWIQKTLIFYFLNVQHSFFKRLGGVMILFPTNFYVDLDFHVCYSHELKTIGAFYSKILSEEINSS